MKKNIFFLFFLLTWFPSQGANPISVGFAPSDLLKEQTYSAKNAKIAKKWAKKVKNPKHGFGGYELLAYIFLLGLLLVIGGIVFLAFKFWITGGILLVLGLLLCSWLFTA